MHTITGQCHCGNLQAKVDLPSELMFLPVIRCTCSFCLMHEPLWLGKPALSCLFRAETAADIRPYRFASPHHSYLICPYCGVNMGCLTQIDEHHYGVVNLKAFVLPSTVSVDITQLNSANESDHVKTERRRLSWIADIRFSTGLAERFVPRQLAV